MRTPIIPLTLAYITGLLLGHGFLYFPCSIIVLAVLSVLITGILTRIDRLTLPRLPLIIIAGLVGMAAYLYSAAWSPADHYTRHFTIDKAFHTITGRIASPLDRDPDRTGFVVEISELDGSAMTGKIRLSVGGQMNSAGYGDNISVRGKLFEPAGFNNPRGFDYAGYLAQSNIAVTMYSKDPGAVQVINRGAGMFRTIQDWRERIRQSFLESTTGDGSAILQAMVLGEEGRLTDGLRDRFMAAGVTHIISISGSHLGMVAILCFGLIRWLLFMMPERFYHRLTLATDPKIIAAWLTLPLVVFYTLLAGGQVATVRSLIMISAGLLAVISDREHALMHALALAALVVLIGNPQAIFDISFQLSFLSVTVIGYVVSLWSELHVKAETRFQAIRNSALLLIIISLSTGLATGPLVAYYFNQISFAGLVSNLVIIPFAGMVVVPLGLFSGIYALFAHHLPLGWLNQTIADMFVSAVSFFSGLPFAEFHPPAPTLLWLLLYAFFFTSLFMHIRARLLSRFKPFGSSSRVSLPLLISMALSGTCLLLPLALSLMPEQRLLVSFPDVGQGDCALIELPTGQTILIDGGGTRDNRFDVGRRILAPWLWNRGIRRLDLVVLSHPHPDHMNGLIAILKKFNVAAVWESRLDTDLPGYGEFLAVMQDRKIPHRVVSADDPPTMFGEAVISVLHPRRGFFSHERQAYSAENNRSIVLQIKSEGRDLLFMGDVGTEVERTIMMSMRGMKTDLIKVPHHGSKSSSSEDFVIQTKPVVAVMTVGRGNPYHHPSDEVLERYGKIGALICRTDRDGAVTIAVKKENLAIHRWKDLILRRIVLDGRAAWGEQELANWGRLRIRASEL